jgi:hypothetical protein
MALKDPKLNDTATATAAVLKLYTSTTGISSRNGNRTLATSNSTLHDLSEGQFPISFSTANLSRRDWLRLGAVAVGGTVVGGATIRHSWMDHQLYQRRHPAILLPKKLAPVNLTQVARETSLNVTLDYPKTIVSLDHSTFQKKQSIKLPGWVPPYLVPQPVVIRIIPDSELLISAVVAGSAVEMFRTVLLYPLLTLKTRIQVDIGKRQRTRQRQLLLARRWRVMQMNVRKHWRGGQLYAGVVPSLLVSVPATGVYYGVRDVVKRTLYPFVGMEHDVAIAVTAAMVADVVALLIRTPADALAIRLQVVSGEQSHNATAGNDTNVEDLVGNWFVESIERLPAVILTDLPFLLSKVAINRIILPNGADIGRYELTSITVALLCAFLTTPFDVARTRLLIDSDDNPDNGIDGGTGTGLLRTFQAIKKEGDGGVRNLFAGCLERTAYLGVGRAWIEPIQLLGYMWIRDVILLQWFD